MNLDVNQKQAFISGEGDCWYERNSHLDIEKRVRNDLILKEINRLNIKIESCLEIGCAEGWRLAEIYRIYNCNCFGIEPSKKAIDQGSSVYPMLNLEQGTADALPYQDGSMSLVIVGFCLYLCDRNELFRIANEIDRVLSDDGVLMILDFYTETPYRNEYSHLEGVSSFKMDYSKMFSWNPNYQLISKCVSDHSNNKIVIDKNERISLCSLRKSTQDAYSEKPEYK